MTMHPLTASAIALRLMCEEPRLFPGWSVQRNDLGLEDSAQDCWSGGVFSVIFEQIRPISMISWSKLTAEWWLFC
jgi:hypothetical protein